MANNDSGDTRNTETATKKYSDFSNGIMYELHGAKSLADATRALILSHENGDSDRELLGATFVLEHLMDKLNRVVLQLDASSFSYATKEKATA